MALKLSYITGTGSLKIKLFQIQIIKRPLLLQLTISNGKLKAMKQMRWCKDSRHQTSLIFIVLFVCLFTFISFSLLATVFSKTEFRWVQQTDEQSCSDAALVVQPPYHNQSSTAVLDCPTTPHLTADYVNMSSNHPTLIRQAHNQPTL